MRKIFSIVILLLVIFGCATTPQINSNKQVESSIVVNTQVISDSLQKEITDRDIIEWSFSLPRIVG